MKYIHRMESPLGRIVLASDGMGLTGLWFENQKYFAAGVSEQAEEKDLPIWKQTERWLAMYFDGQAPDFYPEIHLSGTPFQRAVWQCLQQIPYGTVTTYGAIAKQLAKKGPVSAQAVGGAVGRNPVSVLVPCHRVVGRNGSLTGYAGGLDKKQRLLALEGIDTTQFYRPKRGSAL